MRGLGAVRRGLRDATPDVYSQQENREPFYYQSSVGIPAIGGKATVLSFPVKPGRNGYIWKVAIDYVGAGFTEGNGAIVWRIFRDAAQTEAIKGFNNLVASVGAVNNPVEIGAPIRIYEQQTISIVVYNVAGPNPPAGQVSVGVLQGWFYPKMQQDQSRWP